jgi:hypothetical protein
LDTLIFTEVPAVTIATNTFIQVPIILQYEDTPLIQIVKSQEAGFTTEIPIYHPDGTYLAKVTGSRLFTTQDGNKAGLTLEHPPQKTVCKLGNKILFEIERAEAAALKTSAELYTPDGYFVKCSDPQTTGLYDASEKAIRIGGLIMWGNVFGGCRIGILVRKDGSLSIACS